MRLSPEQLNKLKSRFNKIVLEEFSTEDVAATNFETFFRRADDPKNQDNEPTKEIVFTIKLVV